MTLQDEQKPIDLEICDAMVASTPETWNIIILEFEKPDETSGIGEFGHSLISPEGHPPVMPDDSLYTATYHLDELIQRHGGLLKKAIYRVDLNEDSWQYTADFEYYKNRP